MYERFEDEEKSEKKNENGGREGKKKKEKKKEKRKTIRKFRSAKVRYLKSKLGSILDAEINV